MTMSRKQQLEMEVQRRNALQQELDKRQSEEKRIQNQDIFRKLGMAGTPSHIRDPLAGLLEGVKETAQMLEPVIRPNQGINLFSLKPQEDIGQFVTGKPFQYRRESVLKDIDPYAMMGTKEQPWNTASGAEQAIGKYGIPAYGLGKSLYDIGKKVLPKIYPRTSEEVINHIKNLPDQISKSITEFLGKGAEKVTDVEKKIGSHLYEGSKAQKDLAINSYLNPLKKQFGNDVPYTLKQEPSVVEHIPGKIISPEGKPLSYTTKTTPGKSYYETPKLVLPFKNNKVNKIYQDYVKKPNINNMFDLQRTLGQQAAELRRGSFGLPEQRQYEAMMDYREKILDEMHNYFSSKGKKYADMFQGFRDVYSNEYKAYQAHKQLKDITSGKETIPKEPHKIFDRPGNVKGKKGEEITSDINTIREHMPQEFNDLILFSKVGGHQSGEKLLTKLKDAYNKGYSEYFNPQLETWVKDLERALEEKAMLPEKLSKEAARRKKTVKTAIGLGGTLEAGRRVKNYLTE